MKYYTQRCQFLHWYVLEGLGVGNIIQINKYFLIKCFEIFFLINISFLLRLCSFFNSLWSFTYFFILWLFFSRFSRIYLSIINFFFFPALLPPSHLLFLYFLSYWIFWFSVSQVIAAVVRFSTSFTCRTLTHQCWK